MSGQLHAVHNVNRRRTDRTKNHVCLPASEPPLPWKLISPTAEKEKSLTLSKI